MKLLSRIFLITYLLPLYAYTYLDLNKLYIDLHKNPELSFQEKRTSELLVTYLSQVVIGKENIFTFDPIQAIELIYIINFFYAFG